MIYLFLLIEVDIGIFKEELMDWSIPFPSKLIISGAVPEVLIEHSISELGDLCKDVHVAFEESIEDSEEHTEDRDHQFKEQFDIVLFRS